MVFLTFFGEAKTPVSRKPGIPMLIPLVILAFLSLVVGFVELPPIMGSLTLFSDFMNTALPAAVISHSGMRTELVLLLIVSSIEFGAIYFAYLLYLRSPQYRERFLNSVPFSRSMDRFWFSGWGFDWLYDVFIVKPFVWIARSAKDDVVDLLYQGITWYSALFHKALRRIQTGKVRWYATGIAIGAIITIGIAIFV
jgi:NADH-quinone oxidoreductase subunit L